MIYKSAGRRAQGMGHGAWRNVVFYAVLVLTFQVLLFTAVEAKVYIDITSPSAKKLPIAIYDLQGAQGKEIADIIRDDLTFTGLFICIDKASYIEPISQKFNQQNWKPLGIEAVVKGTMTAAQGLSVDIAVYDVFEGKEMLSKQYQSSKDLLRQLAHNISNDIYKVFTNQTGMFRTKIAFVAEDDREKGIYVMDWDGQRVRKLGLKGSLVLAPHWSADGTKIVYSSERGRQWGIYLLDFGKMTERRIFASKGTNMAGSFLPTGDAITLSSTKDGTPDIYVLSLKDETMKKLTFTQGIEVSPAVSPDGSQIAFVSDRGGSPQIYMMRADGSDIRRVTFEGSYNTSPAWSPAGDRIVFSCRRGKNQICIVKPDGSALVQLTESGNNEDPSFSPEGRYITFSSDRDGTKGIYIMRANGETQKKVSPPGLRSNAPTWSPN
ncbi:MAG: Tol-Pal system beta propeller repeat protein TolB [Nitrospirae bacterium]|nr:Tol-Pal system beta propeller repeat protein TolB [Nitrospirota bacterium]